LAYTRLTIEDLINIKRRDTSVKACVNIGDLIKVSLDNDHIIGIVLEVDNKTMKIQNSQGGINWVSLYVIYEILQYSNKKGVTVGQKDKDKKTKKRKSK